MYAQMVDTGATKVQALDAMSSEERAFRNASTPASKSSPKTG